ncbi:diaminopimelate epimerase [Dongia mobilis]|uniref:Diaminopimelate epimerase n=1 Tax=Dongia mobilis TaxID=578943 RepID=A0A4R6WT98_9PROT|nr:diaminopimelate epimerase [Dongia mobilis]TDQ83248.1 diaminopimelate epimerase [Dongia mobilis]
MSDKLPFIKMHGLGNDFVVLDARRHALNLTTEQRQWLADRHRGIGCDQLITLENAPDSRADVFMRIHNADGSEARACGNATRCVAARVMGEKGNGHAVIQTVAGLLPAEVQPGGEIAVDMGPALLDWQDIPVAAPCDTLRLPVAHGPVADPVGVNVGSPHAVFFVEDVAALDIAEIGPLLERHAFFPDRANIEFAQVIDPGYIRMRVWERGTGITLACGSGACATLVAAARRGLTGRKAVVEVDGGRLAIEWLANGHVRMTGPWTLSFAGEVDLAEARHG